MRIGIDLGGTKTEFIALNPDGKALKRFRHPTPFADYEGSIELIRENVCLIESALGETGSVGIGIPGSVSPASGLVVNANSTWLNGRDLLADIQNALDRPVRLANDANCFALSEAVDGAAAGAHSVFGVILGTGVGGGIVIDQQCISGPNAIGGEWGHNPLPPDSNDPIEDRPCWCGRLNCTETWLSGPALEHQYAKLTGKRLKAADIAIAAEAGQSAANNLLSSYERRLARALGAVINLLDPDVIVLGGGLSNIDRFYRTIPEFWLDYIFAESVTTRLVPAMHGDSSGVRGAAWLWPENQES